MIKRIINSVVLMTFLTVNLVSVSEAKASVLNLPTPGTMVLTSPAFMPVMVKGLRVYPNNPLLFDFILDSGNSGLPVNSPKFKDESSKLINYFLAALTVKDNDQWVNLSPYEKDKITSEDLGNTALGRDMLAQDYILKQITASMIYPEKELGRKFWNRVYEQVQQRFGNQTIPMNTFNKVWIVADKAKVIERNNTAYVIDGHLKVMLEEDYLALSKSRDRYNFLKNSAGHQFSSSTNVVAQIIREIVVPQIEQEVNKGEHFAPLRQIFYSMILATWYKKTLKQALLNQVYSNQGKTAGTLANDPSINDKIYTQYLEAYKKGVFNYIKEDLAKAGQKPVARKYFSGGIPQNLRIDLAMEVVGALLPSENRQMAPKGDLAMASVRVDRAMGASSAFRIPTNHKISVVNDLIGGPTIHHFTFSANEELDKFLNEVGFSKEQLAVISGILNNPEFEAQLWTKVGPHHNPYLVFGIKGEEEKQFHIEFVTYPTHRSYFRLDNANNHKKIMVRDVRYQFGKLEVEPGSVVEFKNFGESRNVKFGTSGDRGIIDWNNDGRGDFSLPLVQRISQGIANYLKRFNDQQQKAGGKVNNKVLIGYDTRHRNPEFSKETARILAANGFEVLYVASEATPTPVLAILAQQKQVAGVINFTASHSPYTDGGIKFSPGHGGAADSKITSAIEKLANEAISYSFVDYEQARNDKKIVEIDPENAVKVYVNNYLIPTLKNLKDAKGNSAWDDLVNYVSKNPEFNLIVDPMQGTGVMTVQLLYSAIAKDAKRDFFEVIHADNKDPKFTQTEGAPQPSGKYIKPLLEMVAKNQTTMGVAQDGDVDRFGIVDFGGKQLEANDMIPLFAWFLNKEMGLKGAVVKTVATSNFANAVADHLGLELIETPVGFKYAVEKVLNKVNVLVAGEESAHVGVGPLMKSWDDGFAVGLMALLIVAKTGKSLTQYKQEIEKEIGKTFTLKVHTQRDEQGLAKAQVIRLIEDARGELVSGMQTNQIKLADEIKKLLPDQEVVAVNTMDGVKLVLKSGDWILMRPSGTEPAAKLYVEVTDPMRLEEVFKAGLQLMGVGSTDKAVLTSLSSTIDEEFTRGGIDLNAKNMALDVDSSGKAIEFKFDPAMVAEFKKGNFAGVEGVILRIVPIASPLPLLGLSLDPAEDRLVKS